VPLPRRHAEFPPVAGGRRKRGSHAASAPTFETLVQFDGASIGSAPNGIFLRAADGYFYGTTSEGGLSDAGTVFRMDTPGTIAMLHASDGASAMNPGTLVQLGGGTFYGTVSAPDGLRLFEMNATFDVALRRVLNPVGNIRTLIRARDGFFYRTTYFGGADGVGTVFRLNRQGHARVLASLGATPGSPAGTAYADLMQARDGSFYGTTIEGGAYGAGTVFRMSRSGKLAVVHSFDDGAGEPRSDSLFDDVERAVFLRDATTQKGATASLRSRPAISSQ